MPRPVSPLSAAPLKIEGLGKGAASLDGPWQFHLGDNPAWAAPDVDDATGHNGWEQLASSASWATQGHPSYTGYAWYRRRIDLTTAPGASFDMALLIPGISDIYEIYWNGQPVGHLGSFPPHINFFADVPPQTYDLGAASSGVLAIKVLKLPLASNDDGTSGGLEGTPILGSAQVIATTRDALDYQWLRHQQFRFGLASLYGLTALISFLAWLRDRRQWLLFWTTVYIAMMPVDIILNVLRLEISFIWLSFFIQTAIQIREVSHWFLLLWLLHLHDSAKLVRWVRILAVIICVVGLLDGSLSFFYPAVLSEAGYQIADAILTFFVLLPECIPVFLVGYAIFRRKHLDSARWMVAIAALLNGSFYSLQNITSQGSRFTHWTLAARMQATHLTLFGSILPIQTILRTILFLAILYAVLRYASDARRRQAIREQEFQNARELQQVLIPETLPNIPGFTLTSAYKPAQEVGGDFFQIIPLEPDASGGAAGDLRGSTLIVLGDVSGKGLRAAMTVSLLVGSIRALARFLPEPAQMLAELNQRLYGRMQGGLVTCVAIRLDADGHCTIASAGHPAPFLNQREVEIPGALPLGLIPNSTYSETELQLRNGDHLSLYTDGLLEARNSAGELYGFERLGILFGTRPSASQASDEAVAFGQEDDITVLTLTRLAV